MRDIPAARWLVLACALAAPSAGFGQARAAAKEKPAATPAASAAAAKDADLGKKRSVAPDASLAGNIQARGKAAEALGPALDFETFRYAIEVQVSGKRREEMNDLDQLIKLGGNEAEMPGWLFRLAELHWEEAQYLFFEANRRDDAIAKAKGDAAETARLKAEKKALEDRERGEQGEAIARYREIARRFPKYPRLDEVIFFLGENLWKQGRRRDALDAYKALITRYPKSKYVPDAWMAYGEFYFDSAAEKGDRKAALAKALESYKRAAAYTESSVYGYALYKQGWVYYNTGDWNEALDLFRAVIFFGDLPTSTVSADKKLALAREARKDYVRTYSHVGSPQAAPDDFARVGGKDAREMLKTLAGLYYDEGKDKDAILVYHRLIVAQPDSPEAPYFQGRIVTCAGRMGKKDLAVQQATRFVEMLQAVEKRGTPDEATKRALADARRDAETTLRTLAVQYHAEWKKTRDDPVAALAAELYRLHLSVFSDTPYSYEIRFFHAELLYALEKFAEAGEEYTRVAQIDADRMKAPGADGKPQKPGKYLADALESAVLAYDVVAKRAEATEKKPTADAKGKIPLPPEKKQLAEACERYLAMLPNGEKRVEIAYKLANLYYKYNDFAPATKLFTEIADRHPKHELARYAANLALDGYNLQGDYRGMSAQARHFWENGELLRAHPQLKEDLGKVIEGSAFKVVEELEKAGKHAEAADAYVAFVRDWPGSKLAATALFNASVDLVKAGRLDRAMSVRDELLRRYPNDPLTPKIILANAQDREGVADFAHAAEDYEIYYAGWRKAAGPAAAPKAARTRRAPPAPAAEGASSGYEESKARDAIFNAGVLRQGLSQPARAETDRRLYLESWPSSPDSSKVALSIADLYARSGSTAKELRALDDYQENFAKDPSDWLVAQDRKARVYARTGNTAAEHKAYEEALRYWKAHGSPQTERALPVVAQAEYLALEPAFAAYDKIDFAVPNKLSDARKVKWLRDQVGWKGHKLTELQKAYTAIVNMKQAEPAVCALYKIGLGYERFAWALKSAPIPAEFRRDKALADEYRAQLAQLAEAPEKKGAEAYELAMAKARELGVTNACSKAIADVLAKDKSDQAGPAVEKLPELSPPAAVSRVRPEGHGLLATLYEPPKRPAETQATAAPLAPLAPARPVPAAAVGRPGAVKPVSAPAPKATARAEEEPHTPEHRQLPPAPEAMPQPVPDEDLLP